MILLTPAEITQLRSGLADYPHALEALQEIEDCDGDVEDAAISLALKSGQEPDTHEQWLASFSKRYRHIACHPQFREDLTAGQISSLVNHLTQETDCPPLIAAPIAIYIYHFGTDRFCSSLDHSRI